MFLGRVDALFGGCALLGWPTLRVSPHHMVNIELGPFPSSQQLVRNSQITYILQTLALTTMLVPADVVRATVVRCHRTLSMQEKLLCQMVEDTFLVALLL